VAASWSDEARDAFEAYSWPDAREKARARLECEAVASDGRVVFDDLPAAVCRWSRARAADPLAGWTWRGESWKALTEGFERTILEQALAACGGFVAKAARALGTTPRVVSYKAHKYGLSVRGHGRAGSQEFLSPRTTVRSPKSNDR